MAYEIPILNISLIAAADLSAKQYCAVKVDSAGKAALSSTGDNALGILQDKPVAGAVGAVMIAGVTKAVYGDTVTAGGNLSADSAGRLIPTTSTNAVLATALESGAVNEVHAVVIGTHAPSGANSGYVLQFPITLSALANADIVTAFTPGIAGAIRSIQFLTQVPATTAAKACTLTTKIGSTPLTGGVLSLTTVACNTAGKVAAATAVTADNTFSGSDTLTITGSATTAFIEGSGVLLITVG